MQPLSHPGPPPPPTPTPTPAQSLPDQNVAAPSTPPPPPPPQQPTATTPPFHLVIPHPSPHHPHNPTPRPRKPYTTTKVREMWSPSEHDRMLEGLRLYKRDWAKVTRFVGTRSPAQVRSHAQKYFDKVTRDKTDDFVPRPRPKRKSATPYPRKPREERHHALSMALQVPVQMPVPVPVQLPVQGVPMHINPLSLHNVVAQQQEQQHHQQQQQVHHAHPPTPHPSPHLHPYGHPHHPHHHPHHPHPHSHAVPHAHAHAHAHAHTHVHLLPQVHPHLHPHAHPHAHRHAHAHSHSPQLIQPLPAHPSPLFIQVAPSPVPSPQLYPPPSSATSGAPLSFPSPAPVATNGPSTSRFSQSPSLPTSAQQSPSLYGLFSPIPAYQAPLTGTHQSPQLLAPPHLPPPPPPQAFIAASSPALTIAQTPCTPTSFPATPCTTPRSSGVAAANMFQLHQTPPCRHGKRDSCAKCKALQRYGNVFQEIQEATHAGNSTPSIPKMIGVGLGARVAPSPVDVDVVDSNNRKTSSPIPETMDKAMTGSSLKKDVSSESSEHCTPTNNEDAAAKDMDMNKNKKSGSELEKDAEKKKVVARGFSSSPILQPKPPPHRTGRFNVKRSDSNQAKPWSRKRKSRSSDSPSGSDSAASISTRSSSDAGAGSGDVNVNKDRKDTEKTAVKTEAMGDGSGCVPTARHTKKAKSAEPMTQVGVEKKEGKRGATAKRPGSKKAKDKGTRTGTRADGECRIESLSTSEQREIYDAVQSLQILAKRTASTCEQLGASRRTQLTTDVNATTSPKVVIK